MKLNYFILSFTLSGCTEAASLQSSQSSQVDPQSSQINTSVVETFSCEPIPKRPGGELPASLISYSPTDSKKNDYGLEFSVPGNWPTFEKIYPFDPQQERVGTVWVVRCGDKWVNPSGYGWVDLQVAAVSKDSARQGVVKSFEDFCHERYQDYDMREGDLKNLNLLAEFPDNVSGLPIQKYLFPWNKPAGSKKVQQWEAVVLTQSLNFYYEFSLSVEESEYYKFMPLFRDFLKSVKIQ